MSAKDMHSKGTHTLIGVGAAIAGVVLGIGVVYWDGNNTDSLKTQAATSSCPGTNREYACSSCGEELPGGGKCLKGCPICQGTANGKVCPGTCQRPGAGEIACKTTGSCDGKPLEGKPKEMPKEMGGMPPMLPMLPMPMPKMPMPEMPKEPEDPCKVDASSTECKLKQGTNGIGNYLSNLFGTNTNSASSSGNTVQNAVQSVASRLSAFLTGNSGSDAETNAGTRSTTNPTNAVVTPVVSGANAGQITSQTGSSQTGPNASGNTVPNAAVTGFGSTQGGATANEGRLAQISQVLSGIKAALSNMFGSIF